MVRKIKDLINTLERLSIEFAYAVSAARRAACLGQSEKKYQECLKKICMLKNKMRKHRARMKKFCGTRHGIDGKKTFLL